MKPYKLIATWFGSGSLTPASGTWGTLAGLPFCVFITYICGLNGVIFGSMILFILGLWAARRYEIETGVHDSKHVVIDEVVGMMLACIPLLYSFTPITVIACFAMFRLFDAVKIGPVGWLDKNIHGALGVMLDDVAAGLLTAIVVLGGLIWMH